MPPPCFPPTVCDKVPSFPLTGSLGSVRPLHWYYEDTPISAVRLTGSLRSPSDTRVASCPSLPRFKTHSRRAWGFCFGVTRTDWWLRRRRQTSPGSWGTLRRFAWVFDPGGTDTPGPIGVPTRPPLCSTTRAPDEKSLSRLHVQAFRLTVYASPGGSPHHDARLASGCWPALPGGIRTRRVPTEGFRVVVLTSLPPSPGFAWRNEHLTWQPYAAPLAQTVSGPAHYRVSSSLRFFLSSQHAFTNSYSVRR